MSPSLAARPQPLFGMLIALTLLSCQTSSAPENDSPGAAVSAPPETSVPFDVSAVIRQVHFAFRPDGAGWSGGHTTYGVRAGVDGLTLTPVSHPRVTRGEVSAQRARDTGAVVKGAPLSLGAMRWHRGSRPAPAGEVQGRLEQAGHLALTREGFVETIRNTEEGVRQEWGFSSEPGGRGDLTLALSAKGLAYSGDSASGLHFKDARTGLGFRYGHTAWVEASGRSTPLQARYVAGDIQLRVPAAVLASTTFPATVAPVISPEFGMDQPVPGPLSTLLDEPAVASNGSNHLVAWKDYRQGTYQLYGTRVTSAGVVQDVWGLRFTNGTVTPDRPKVASNGTDYLVVWSAPMGGGTHQAQATRVSSSDAQPDIAPFVILPDENTQQLAASVASNGTDYLVAWRNNTASLASLRGTRLSGTGTILDPAGLTLATNTKSLIPESDMASNGTDYLVVWDDERDNGVGDIYGTRVTSTGTVQDPQGIAIATGEKSHRNPAVASNGTDYLVAWTDRRSDAEGDVFAARVTSSTGAVEDSSGIAVSATTGQQALPAVASDGTGYLVSWTDTRSVSFDAELHAARVSPIGTVLDPEGLRLSSYSSKYDAPALTFNGLDYFIAWSGGSSLRGMRVTLAGEGSDAPGIPLVTSASRQRTPAVASNGTQYLVVWYDNRDNGENIIAVRVSATGEVLDTSGLAIDLSSAGGGGYGPVVASNGTDYLVVWKAQRGAESRFVSTRVTSQGQVLHPQGRPISPASLPFVISPSIASNGTDYLVAFTASRLTEPGSRVVGVRISSEGEALDASELRICENPESFPDDPKVASNGTDYLVVWSDSRNSTADIYGARVTNAGAVVDPAGIAITTANDNQRNPAVASNGTDYLVVWGDFRRSSSSDVYGARVASTGEVLDPESIAISTATRWQQLPSITSLGTEYLVVWQDHRVSTSDPNIQGARVTGAGLVRESQGFVISGNPEPEETPAVVSGDGRTALVVYDVDANSEPFWDRRIRGRLVTFSDNRPPSAESLSLSTPEDTPLSVLLHAMDPEGQSLTYDLVSPPRHGVLTGTGDSRTYTPAAHSFGPDSFTFRVSDGEFFSAIATVTLQVTSVNDVPSVPLLLAPAEDALLTSGLVTFQWQPSTDADGDALSYDLEIFQGDTRLRLHRTAETRRPLVDGEQLPPGNYSWSVKAVDSHDVASAASPARAFTIENEDTADAGSTDGGTDAGEPDAGPPDAGPPDAGEETDAGSVDSGVPDAGPQGNDAGTEPPPVGNPPDVSGCGCNPVPSTAPAAPLLLAALGLMARGSRRRRPLPGC
ncbi:cadherin-like domain-containing protein [Pyxidicoccus sp. MSG2]|uniref:cadherin-like domain-containing protein n=1 Tax=Pyxidicoccus sp. MSG2 TaxID=2996790 RepID=UPI00226FB923|nr:cadherin-like domain-containing protein [Pyxidicoccus sp. MSG2]MCY1023848.1 cadherin-like domain-containing protein [Pyxidicoccus sp. MSG2]